MVGECSMKYSYSVWNKWVYEIRVNGRGLTDWEENFVNFLDEQLSRTGSISLKQEEILERIYAEKTP